MKNFLHSPVAKNGLLFKIFTLVVVAGVIVIAVPLLTYLQIAFGWTNPSQNPPGGSGILTAYNGKLGINFSTPTTAELVVNSGSVAAPAIDAMGSRILGVATPTAGSDAANKDYVLAQGGGGGGSLILYYKTISNAPAPPPTCPTGWTAQYTGYGPHYLGLFAHDWLQNGTGGTGGGFAPNFTPPTPNGSNGATYLLRSVAIGSDSVCSQDQQSVVHFSNIYNNQLTYDFTSVHASACFTNPGPPAVTECNMCLVCQK